MSRTGEGFTAENQLQRMLNALEPGSELLSHRHHASSGAVVALRERFRFV